MIKYSGISYPGGIIYSGIHYPGDKIIGDNLFRESVTPAAIHVRSTSVVLNKSLADLTMPNVLFVTPYSRSFFSSRTWKYNHSSSFKALQ